MDIEKIIEEIPNQYKGIKPKIVQYTKIDECNYYIFIENQSDDSNEIFNEKYPDVYKMGFNNILLIAKDNFVIKYAFDIIL
jgi:hypothetical protein